MHENLLKEKEILKYLSSCSDCPSHIIKYRGFFKSKSKYYLILEHGGWPLLNFVRKAHKLINLNKMDIVEWISLVKVIFKQMVDAIAYMHSKNICHFDVSLENTLINDIKILIEDRNKLHEKIKFLSNDDKSVNIKIIDFGLAELFDGDSGFLCSKYCGKEYVLHTIHRLSKLRKVLAVCTNMVCLIACNNYMFRNVEERILNVHYRRSCKYTATHRQDFMHNDRLYKSPEVIAENALFDARANDVWCLGVSLFMMLSGSPPFGIGHHRDPGYQCVMKGKEFIRYLVSGWRKENHFDDSSIDLLSRIFRLESERISLNKLKEHRWLTD